MKKLVPFAIALAFVAAIPSVASALDTRRSFDVTMTSRGRDVDVGTIRFELEGPVDPEDYDLTGLPRVCRYVGRWTNAAHAPSRATFFVDEIPTRGYGDCEDNARESFDTMIELARDERSRGFDVRQQRRIIDDMILQENEDGTLEGFIQFSNGQSYRILLGR